MSTAVFSYRNETMPENGMLSGREQLFAKLEDLAIQPVVTLQAETAYTDEGINVERLVSEDRTEPTGLLPFGDIDLIVNRIGRSFKYDKMPACSQDVMPPVINRNEMRSLAFRKMRVQTEVFSPLGMGISTGLLADRTSLETFMDVERVPEYVVKPNSGGNGDGVTRLSCGELWRSDEAMLDGTKIIQPAYDFTGAFPPGMRAYDSAAQEAFDGWSSSSAVKELRVYGFHSPKSTEVFPVGRAMADGEDHWFMVDPESVPQHILDQTRYAFQRAAKISGSRAVHGSIDSGYGNLPGEEPDFRAIEFNGRAPYVIGYDKHVGVADHLRQLFANMIAETAANNRA